MADEQDTTLGHARARRRLPALWGAARSLAAAAALILFIAALTFTLSSALSQIQRGTPPGPAAKPQPGKIAFVQAGDIWVKELPDGEAKRLTQDGRNSEPRWSPSGEWLAYRKETQVWIVRASGADAHQVPGNAVSWSPVADRLAYVTAAGLFAVNADGSDLRELAKDTNSSQVGGIVWSPDGQSLAFERVEGTPQQPPSAQGLWRIKADGSEATAVYRSPDPVQRESWLVGWSPDGESLLFWSGFRRSGSVPADGLPLLLVPVTGGTPVEVTPIMLPNSDFLDWSPDGQRLAFVDGGDRRSWDRKRIAVVDGDGAARVLSEQGRADLFPAWSPDGKLIAYTSGPAATGVGGGDDARQAMAQRHIWVMAPDGSGKRELTDDPAYRDERPRWSKDGAFILFGRLKDDSMQVWMMRADGADQRLVADDLMVAEVSSASPPLWFGFYGNLAWGRFYDWRSGKPAPKPSVT